MQTNQEATSALSKADEQAIVARLEALLRRFRGSIFNFILDNWGLVPQPVKPAFRRRWLEAQLSEGAEWEKIKTQITGDWFGDPYDEENRGGDWKWFEFEKGKHIAWEQVVILMGIDKAIAGKASRTLSIRSGHGIGKSSTCAWIILWFLFCYISKVPVTAPTSHQMHDVLWTELSSWIGRMSEEFRAMYEWSNDYVRMSINPEEWFARARTSTKENTEAIAGIHADHVCIVVDEASGVPEQVFNAAEGALTSGSVLVILISNPTRIDGYFYDTHHKNKATWQLFAFNSEEAPLVDRSFIALKARHGVDSDEYKIRVKGIFASESSMDTSGYIQLINEKKVTVILRTKEPPRLIGRKILSVDPSGEGKNKTTFVIRDQFTAYLAYQLEGTNEKEIAHHVLTLIDEFNLTGDDVVIDGFGIGARIGQIIAVETKGKVNVYTVLTGTHPVVEESMNRQYFRRRELEMDNDGTDLYLNLRAVGCFRAQQWLYAGGTIIDTDLQSGPFLTQLLDLAYMRSMQGNKRQIMGKKDMLKKGIQSPDIADAFTNSFLLEQETGIQDPEERDDIIRRNRAKKARFDPFKSL